MSVRAPYSHKAKVSRNVGGVDLWRCGKCQEWKPPSDYYKRESSPNGLRSACKRCHIATSMATADPRKRRKSRRESARRVRAKNPDKHRARAREKPPARGVKVDARRKLNHAIRAGSLVRPDCCSTCGRSDLRIEGHHEDYSKPLVVEWLCSECHGERHWKPAGQQASR